MKRHDECLPCLINQVIKVAHMSEVQNKEELYHKIFAYLSELDFSKTNPEIIGATFKMLKEHIGNDDPYKDIRHYYNHMFLENRNMFKKRIEQSDNILKTVIKYAIVGNIIDFNPMHNHDIDDIMNCFSHIDEFTLTIDHVSALINDLKSAKTLLYLGDNCGEICLDYLFIEKIKEINPDLHIYFGVRGEAVVNDSIEQDAYDVGINDYADIISNGDDSLGTILSRVSPEFSRIYYQADVVIAKGQANYESLSEEIDKNIYFLLMVKCAVIARDIGVDQKAMICLSQKKRYEK